MDDRKTGPIKELLVMAALTAGIVVAATLGCAFGFWIAGY